MQNDSWRHHYIPQFFIKNFYNSKNEIWVYDKEYDKILKQPKVSKSIFYEPHKNSLKYDGKLYPEIEEYYKIIDDKHAKHLVDLNLLTKSEIINNESITKSLIYFANWLLWRMPRYDKLIEDLITENFYFINSKYYSNKLPNLDLDKSNLIKIIRAYLPFQLLTQNNQILDLKVLVIETVHPTIFITDNAILINEHPELLETVPIPFIIPISPNKIFTVLTGDDYTINSSIINQINFELMYRAKKYVASPSRSYLEDYINGYRKYRNMGDEGSKLSLIDIFKKLNTNNER